MSVPMIDSSDGFELVRNAVANILVAESAYQVALATTAGKSDPTEWALDVYSERSNPFELFRDESNESTQLINVWYESSDIDTGRSTQARQWTNTRINVDCVACARTEETTSGQNTGDESAFLRVQKMARLVRRILMHPDYRQLGIPSIVNTRNLISRRSYQPQQEQVGAYHIAGLQLQFDVSHYEFYDFAELNVYEGALVTVKRSPTGAIMFQMDYDWSEE